MYNNKQKYLGQSLEEWPTNSNLFSDFEYASKAPQFYPSY